MRYAEWCGSCLYRSCCAVVCRQLSKLSDLLLNADVDVRICAGETIALLYELARADEEVVSLFLL